MQTLNLDADPLLQVPVLRREAAHWRSEAAALRERLQATEREAEAASCRLKGALDAKEKQTRAAQERQAWGETRVASLADESRQTAATCRELSLTLERQAEQNRILREQLRRSEDECEGLKRSLRATRASELDRAVRLVDAEARYVRAVPHLREELEAAEKEARIQASLKIAEVEQRLYGQISELEAAAAQARQHCAELGRRCEATTQQAQAQEGAALAWQGRAQAAERELARLGLESHKVWDLSCKQRAELHRQEALSRELQVERDRAVKVAAAAAESSSTMQHWMERSMAEVNRSAHKSAGRMSKVKEDSLRDPGMVSMLEAFREQQTRNGFGSRTR